MAVRTATNRVVSLLATAVRVVAAVIGAILVVHCGFRAVRRQPRQPGGRAHHRRAGTFGWFTENLFRTDDATIGEAINDAIAALIYVVVGSLVSKLVLRLAPSAKATAKAKA